MTSEEKLIKVIEYLNLHNPSGKSTYFLTFGLEKEGYRASIKCQEDFGSVRTSWSAPTFAELVAPALEKAQSWIENRLKGLYEEAIKKQEEASKALNILTNQNNALIDSFNKFKSSLEEKPQTTNQ